MEDGDTLFNEIIFYGLLAMQNPWVNLPLSAPFILDCDRQIVDQFNIEATKEYRFNLQTPPLPFIGDPMTAKVILLQLNPGSDFSPGFIEPNEILEHQIFPTLDQDNRNNIIHRYGEFPFYYLNPAHRLISGFRYWSRIFSPMISDIQDYQRIANNVSCLEYLPYHSVQAQALNSILESQKYGFDLLTAVLCRKATVIVMRGEDRWLKSVPALKDFKYLTPRSPRNPIISERNFPETFGEIRSLILQN